MRSFVLHQNSLARMIRLPTANPPDSVDTPSAHSFEAQFRAEVLP